MKSSSDSVRAERGGEKWTSCVRGAVTPQLRAKQCCGFLARMSSVGVVVQSTGGERFTFLGLRVDNQSACSSWTKNRSFTKKE